LEENLVCSKTKPHLLADQTDALSDWPGNGPLKRGKNCDVSQVSSFEIVIGSVEDEGSTYRRFRASPRFDQGPCDELETMTHATVNLVLT
jgi:hypothetical protein